MVFIKKIGAIMYIYFFTKPYIVVINGSVSMSRCFEWVNTQHMFYREIKIEMKMKKIFFFDILI